MSCWLLAMVTHARLQSELQVRDPLVRSVSFVSFISCPLLLKQKGGKKREEKVLVRAPKQTSSLFSLSRKVPPGFIPEGTWDPICTGEMTPLQPQQLRLHKEEEDGPQVRKAQHRQPAGGRKREE